jgi:hypothetical protein
MNPNMMGFWESQIMRLLLNWPRLRQSLRVGVSVGVNWLCEVFSSRFSERFESKFWWAMQGSNLRPSVCKTDALSG